MFEHGSETDAFRIGVLDKYISSPAHRRDLLGRVGKHVDIHAEPWRNQVENAADAIGEPFGEWPGNDEIQITPFTIITSGIAPDEKDGTSRDCIGYCVDVVSDSFKRGLRKEITFSAQETHSSASSFV